MNLIEELFSRQWIIKKEDSELYYQVKDHAKEIRKKLQDKFGYALIMNPYLIKLEKIPGKAEPWMGIQDFQTPKEYQMLCYLLMFLEDKSAEDQFVLSNITEYVQVQFVKEPLDLTKFHVRKAFVRVLRYAIRIGLMLQVDGEDELFLQSETAEVLYENTGVSKYMMRNFTTDIMKYEQLEDFENSGWFGMDEDRGIIRRQRIYRRLSLSPGVYKHSVKEDEDFNYIRNYRNKMEQDFQNLFSCELQVHASSAYLILKDDGKMGKTFPSNTTKDDLLLLANGEIRRRIKNYSWRVDELEQLHIKQEELQKVFRKVVQNNMEKLPKTYQKQGKEALASMMMDNAKKLGFLEIEKEEMVTVYPVVGKLYGAYQGG